MYWLGFLTALVLVFLWFQVASGLLWLFVPPPNRWFKR